MMQLKSLRDAPNTQREYETIFILRSDTTSDNIQDVNSRVRKVIEELGGKVLRVDNWGKRNLAYEIRKQLKGIYLYWHYLGEAQLVAEIERNLRMLDLVIRYYSVRIDQDVNPEARPSMMDDETFLAAATIIPDEEDTYMGRSYDDHEDDDFHGDDLEDDFELDVHGAGGFGGGKKKIDDDGNEPVSDDGSAKIEEE
jgi:small subunit ribosomal protein S6